MPLPNVISWYAHYFPLWFLKTATVFAEINDLFVPLMFLIPIRSIKKLAFYIQVKLNIKKINIINAFNLIDSIVKNKFS